MFLFRKFSARNLQTNYLFKTVSKRYFSHRLVLGVIINISHEQQIKLFHDKLELKANQSESSTEWGGGGCNPKKNRKKPVPNLKLEVAFGFFGFFRFFFGIFRFFVVLFRFFSV